MSYSPPSYPPPSYPPQPYMQAPVPAKGVRNTLGLIAMIVAIVGFIFACVPGVLIVGWILLPISFILGLVAVFRQGETKWQAVTAIIVAVVGSIVGALVFVVVVADAVDEAVSSQTSAQAPVVAEAPAQDERAVTSQPEAAAEEQSSTRDNPLPLGTEVKSREWSVVVSSVTFDATDAVLAENMFNDPPQPGTEYIIVNYSVTYTGNDPNGQSPIFVGVNYVTADGVTIDGTESLVVAPQEIDRLTTLYNGGSVSGNIVLQVPSATAQDGVLAVEPGLIEDKVFIAVK